MWCVHVGVSVVVCVWGGGTFCSVHASSTHNGSPPLQSWNHRIWKWEVHGTSVCGWEGNCLGVQLGRCRQGLILCVSVCTCAFVRVCVSMRVCVFVCVRVNVYKVVCT